MPNVLSLATTKKFLRITTTGDDSLINVLMAGAEDLFQRLTGIALTQQTVTEDVDGGGYALRLSRQPIHSITSITDEHADATIDSTAYEILDHREIVRTADDRWEKGRARFRVVAVVGYGTDADDSLSEDTQIAVPDAIHVALLNLVRRAYDKRGAAKETANGWSIDWDAVDADECLAAFMDMSV